MSKLKRAEAGLPVVPTALEKANPESSPLLAKSSMLATPGFAPM